MESLFRAIIRMQILLHIGGNTTPRGTHQDRYFDRSSTVINHEFQFSIVWQCGAVLGVHVETSFGGLQHESLKHWAWLPITNLRFFSEGCMILLDDSMWTETNGLSSNFARCFWDGKRNE